MGYNASKHVYSGAFIAPEDIEKIRKVIPGCALDREIQYPHVTFTFKCDPIFEDAFGADVHIEVIGYGNDGSNEAVQVSLSAEHPRVQEILSRIYLENPHITLSTRGSTCPRNSRYLSFVPLETPIAISGKYGAFTKERIVDIGQDNPVAEVV